MNWRYRAVIGAAFALFIAAYANSLHNGFHFDDGHTVQSNPFIRDLSNIPRFFTDARTFSSHPPNQTYRPLFSVSVALDYALGRGIEPVVFHGSQLLLFAIVGVLLAAFYRRTLRQVDPAHAGWAAILAATLFCVHTGNTQTANYISSRSELIAAIGILAGFLLYQRSPAARRWHLYLIPVILGALGKNLAVMFAPLLLAYKLLVEEELSVGAIFSRAAWPRVRSALLSSIPAFVILPALFVFIESMNPPGQTYGGGSRGDYLLTQTWVWVRYAQLYVLPVGLTADTDLSLFHRVDARVVTGVALLVGSLALAWFASRRHALRPVAFGIAWFWLALVPTSSVVPLAEVTNDHRPFLPFMGLNLAVVWGLWAYLRHRSPRIQRIALAAAGVILITHAVGTHVRNRAWRNDESLWSDVARKSPKNGRGIMNYGLVLMRQGKLPEARDLFLKAQSLAPNYSYVDINLGIVNAAMRNDGEAERHFRRAIELTPDQPSVHRFYAGFLANHGRASEAIEHYRQAVATGGGELETRHALLWLYAAAQRADDVRRLATETLAMLPSDSVSQAFAAGRVPMSPEGDGAQGWFNRGFGLTRADRHAEAVAAYREAIRLDPRHADALNNLGWTLGRLGFYDLAVPILERAVAAQPSELARNNLAWVRGAARSAAR